MCSMTKEERLLSTLLLLANILELLQYSLDTGVCEWVGSLRGVSVGVSYSLHFTRFGIFRKADDPFECQHSGLPGGNSPWTRSVDQAVPDCQTTT